MKAERVVIVGAGAAGLACAIDLAAGGAPVLVLEADGLPGGKIHAVRAGSSLIDAGPTVFTMPWVFADLAERAGRRLEEVLDLTPLETLARHAWSDHERLDLFSDPARSEAAIGAFSGAISARAFRAFHKEAGAIFATLRRSFLERELTGPLGLTARVGLPRFGEVLALRPFSTLAGRLAEYFDDPRLRQLFGRYATYCGSSPYLAPATLMLVAHVEQAGVFSLAGGMSRLAEALAEMATGVGAQIRYGAEVARILVERGRVAGVELRDGERIDASHVVFNGDPAALAAGGLGPDVRCAGRTRSFKERSLSAVTFALEGHASGFALDRHNVFFSRDYRREFEEILGERRLPTAPTVYVCAQDRGPAERGRRPAAGDAERFFLLVNAPARGEAGEFAAEELSACMTGILDHLERCGLKITPQAPTVQTATPARFHSRFPASSGALYGSPTHGWSGAFQRPGSGTPIPGLCLAGGGSHPGPGVPMAVLSGRIAAERVRRTLASTLRFHRGAIFGGTSTLSVPTAATASPSSPS